MAKAQNKGKTMSEETKKKLGASMRRSHALKKQAQEAAARAAGAPPALPAPVTASFPLDAIPARPNGAGVDGRKVMTAKKRKMLAANAAKGRAALATKHQQARATEVFGSKAELALELARLFNKLL